MIGKKEIQHWKLKEVDQLVELFKTYKHIAVIEVSRLNDKQIQEMRKILRGKAVIRMSKKNLQLLAIENFKTSTKNKNLDELANNIPGQAVLCFTNMEIYELKNIFNNHEWMVPAKPNEVAPVDIWVPAGDTGLPTGADSILRGGTRPCSAWAASGWYRCTSVSARCSARRPGS